MELPDLPPDASASVELVVGDADTALAFRSGDVAVLATPRLVALCEEATVAAVAAYVPAGYTTVGSRVELHHVKATAVGETVTAQARLAEAHGRRLLFEVSARDAQGPVAAGSVTRVVVDRERFGG